MSASPIGKVGKYELLERIATGGMAELFKAQVSGEHGFKKLVCIKKILPHLALDTTFVEMFIDEARITAMLEHPNIVQVFEFGKESGDLFIAMQFVDGLDLLTLLRECKRLGTKIPAELAVHIAHDILDALDYAHNATDEMGKKLGIVHRDISPGNVLLSQRGDVKLTDFGIAWAYEKHHKTEAGKLKGKFGYMSPELVGGGLIDPRSDIFSTGIILAEMLMGRHLFTAPNDLDVLLMVRDAQIDRLDKYGGDVPDSLRSILEQSLARMPAARFSSAAVFRDALGDWLFEHNARVSSRHLARFIERVQSGDRSLVAEPDELRQERKGMDSPTLSGTLTQRRRAAARREADIGRAVFSASRPPQPTPGAPLPAVPIEIGDEVSSGIIIEVKSASPSHQPTEQGDFSVISPIRLLYRQAIDRADGLLLAEGRAGTLKEAYLSSGHPEFVASNVKSEQLGEYLIAKRVISPEELSRAVAVLGHFGGRLSDTLVGLGLLEPLEVFRLLGLQAGEKLIDVCTWRSGRYRWYADRKNPWPQRRLHLDTYELIGQGASLLPVEEVSSGQSRSPTGGPFALSTSPTSTASAWARPSIGPSTCSTEPPRSAIWPAASPSSRRGCSSCASCICSPSATWSTCRRGDPSRARSFAVAGFLAPKRTIE